MQYTYTCTRNPKKPAQRSAEKSKMYERTSTSDSMELRWGGPRVRNGSAGDEEVRLLNECMNMIKSRAKAARVELLGHCFIFLCCSNILMPERYKVNLIW